MISLSKAEIIRIRNYLLVGGSAFLFEYGIFVLFDELVSTPLLVAQSVSFSFGLAVSFFGSRYITFAVKNEAHSHKARVQIVSFLFLGLFNLFASNAIIYVFVEHLGIYSLIAKVLVMACIVVWNYLIFSKLIFKQT